MRLKTLLEGIECSIIQGSPDIEISGIAYDSRKVEAGSLFVCLVGYNSDGHGYINAAVEKGASAVLVERDDVQAEGAVVVKTADTRRALALMSAVFFGNPAKKMTVIGITGTKGKTTTSHMIKDILEKSGNKAGLIGTLGAKIGDESAKTLNTTPESYELHSLFGRMVQAGCKYVVMEVSSQALKMHRVEGITFDYGIFTNLSPDHIGDNEHSSFEEYLYCKSLLFRQTSRAIINTDDENWEKVFGGAGCPVITVSAKGEADYRAQSVEKLRGIGFLGSRFELGGREHAQVYLNMPGRYNVSNALCAIAVCSDMGIGMEYIAEALRSIGVRGRTEILKTSGDYIILIDYAHNALSMENLLAMLKGYEPHRLICLFGGGGNRAKARRYDMGKASGKYADLTVLTMDNPRFESVKSINEDILEGLAEYKGKHIMIEDRKEAIQYVIDEAEKGDIIALIGKGHEEYQEIEGVKYYFSEREIVSEYV